MLNSLEDKEDDLHMEDDLHRRQGEILHLQDDLLHRQEEDEVQIGDHWIINNMRKTYTFCEVWFLAFGYEYSL